MTDTVCSCSKLIGNLRVHSGVVSRVDRNPIETERTRQKLVVSDVLDQATHDLSCTLVDLVVDRGIGQVLACKVHPVKVRGDPIVFTPPAFALR